MITAKQITLIHVAKSKARLNGQPLNDQQYRMVLQNAAGVRSCKELIDQASYEDVMAVFEGLGFQDKEGGGDYWSAKVRKRGSEAGDRMIHKIETLAADPANKYPLAALVHRMSDKRTDDVRRLYPREAWMLIEALKAIVIREPVPASLTNPTPTVDPAPSTSDIPF